MKISFQPVIIAQELIRLHGLVWARQIKAAQIYMDYAARLMAPQVGWQRASAPVSEPVGASPQTDDAGTRARRRPSMPAALPDAVSNLVAD